MAVLSLEGVILVNSQFSTLKGSRRTNTRAVVVAQLVELLLLTPEIRGFIPDIGKILSTNWTIEKTKIKKKKPGMDRLYKESQ